MTDALRTQAPAAVLMVRPVAFGFNPQTADTNPFQQQKVRDADFKISIEGGSVRSMMAGIHLPR